MAEEEKRSPLTDEEPVMQEEALPQAEGEAVPENESGSPAPAKEAVQEAAPPTESTAAADSTSAAETAPQADSPAAAQSTAAGGGVTPADSPAAAEAAEPAAVPLTWKEKRARKKQEKLERKLAEKRAKEEEKQRIREEKARRREANRPKRRRALILTVVLLGIFLAGAGAAYYHYVEYFRTHFYSGTTINGQDVSYKTVSDIKSSIEKDISKYQLAVKERDGSEEILTAADVGWAYADDGRVDELMQEQDPWKWITSISRAKDYSVTAGTTYDQEKAKSAILKLKAVTEGTTDPVDATVQLKDDGTYEIIPETEGNRVDTDKLTAAVLDALDQAKDTVDISEDTDCYIHPAVYSDNEQLVARRDAWNKYASISITYTFGDSKEVVDGTLLKQYMTDNGQEVTLATDWIKTLIYQWGQKYDTFGLERSFTTHSGNVITIPAGGDYGWCLNKEKMINDLTEAISNGESGDRNPIWLFSAMGWDNGDITGTYVEVSLSEQKLFLWKNGQNILTTDVVTGTPTADRETKPGIWAIDAKKSPATLGTLDVQGYSSPVSYWAPFNGGQGLHDAPWRTAFGGNIYQTNGSHGCINIPVDAAKTVYETVSIGTAVIVY